MASKTYVLDTNVLIQAPHALFSFDDNAIVLPVAVMEELDRLKNDDGERGMNARLVVRTLDQLRSGGSLTNGVLLPGGGSLRIEMNCSGIKLPDHWPTANADNRILQVCRGLQEQGTRAILVSRDIISRIKADILNIPAEDFLTDQSPSPEQQYRGRIEVLAADEDLSHFKKKGILPELVYTLGKDGQVLAVEPILNQFFIIKSDTSSNRSFLGRFNGESIVPLTFANRQPFGVKPRSAGQRFLQEALMASPKDAPLVIVKGTAGTAKTFYSLAVGLHKILEESEPIYRRILISRPNVQFDEEIGFLPGSEKEKIAPLMRPIIDNLEILIDRAEKERYRNESELRGKIDELFERGIISAEAMNFIRGRSITQTYLIIDEAQNLTPRQVKGIITRVGTGTKVILLGDPEQIDHPLLDARTNGLSYAAEKMKDSPLCWQITMETDECERSELAWDASQRM